MPGWCLCGFGVRVLSAEAGLGRANHSQGLMSLWVPSLQLHLLHKSSSAHSSPCPTLCQRLKKACLIFLTLMKTHIIKANLSHRKNSKVRRWGLISCCVSQVIWLMLDQGVYFTQSISTLKNPREKWGFLISFSAVFLLVRKKNSF